MRRNSQQRRRAGWTLVELVTAMTAGAALMGVTIAALVAVQRADRRFARKISDRQAIEPLVGQLRADAHAAQLATWDADSKKLTFALAAGGSASYQQEAGRWERYVAESTDGSPQLAGAFPVDDDAKFTIEPHVAEAGSVINIAWSAPAERPGPGRTSPLQVEVVAAVGRDMALLQQ